MGFLDFLFGKNKKINIEDNNLFGPANTVPTDLIGLDEEFSKDLVADELETPVYEENNCYFQNGVCMKNAQNTFKLIYDGILVKNGSNEVQAIVGYGNNLNWEDVGEYKMSKTKDNKKTEKPAEKDNKKDDKKSNTLNKTEKKNLNKKNLNKGNKKDTPTTENQKDSKLNNNEKKQNNN